MFTILIFLPVSTRLYPEMVNGVRQRLRSEFRLQVVEFPRDDRKMESLLQFCSRRTAETRFRRETGFTIQQAITDARLERAVVLLKNPAIQG